MASANNKSSSTGAANSHQIIIPMTRVRTIMKSSPEITNISQDTLYMVCKATEMFIKSFAQEASKGSKSNELDYQSLADIVAKDEKFQFLNEIVPYKVKAKDALKIIETENKKSLIK